jgi:hypothetical protein
MKKVFCGARHLMILTCTILSFKFKHHYFGVALAPSKYWGQALQSYTRSRRPRNGGRVLQLNSGVIKEDILLCYWRPCFAVPMGGPMSRTGGASVWGLCDRVNNRSIRGLNASLRSHGWPWRRQECSVFTCVALTEVILGDLL